ncbi:MAG TPA: hypothetical protein VNM69_17970 [Bacillus sp. (in: firmicutes)]|nr:hypothetical protein [Bacillus sp. (in: firmicutes)]
MISEEIKKDLPEHIRRVVECIPKGSKRPITVREISSLTGFSSTAIRSYVSKAIISYGIAIGASNTAGNSGYFIIETSEEREKAKSNLISRIREMNKRVKALDAIGDPNQETLKIG